MTQVTLDNFIEAFSAQLVARGQHRVRLNDPKARDGLYRVYKFLEGSLEQRAGDTDRAWRRSLVTIRNLFQPSAIGSFDRFEALMRAKQVYLTDHPNPYYQDILIRMPAGAARQIINELDEPVSKLVTKSVDEYLTAD